MDGRIRDIDEEGVDVQLLVNPGGPSGHENREVNIEFMRAQHRFLDDFCGKYPHRLKSMIGVNARYIEESVEEIKRWSHSTWAVGVYVGFRSLLTDERTPQEYLAQIRSGGLARQWPAAFELSRLMDDASDKRNIMFNAYDPSSYWAVSDNDRTHIFNVHYIYELPFWRDQNTLAAKALGGWQVSGATIFQSGEPRSVWLNDDRAGVGDTTNQPWNLVGDPNVGNQSFSNGPTADQNFWFNPQAFARPAPGTFGNAGRNPVRGPHQQNWDFALFKTFGPPSGTRIQLRAEAFNFPNYPNLSNPQTNPTNGSFGRVTAKTSERNIQLSLKVLF